MSAVPILKEGKNLSEWLEMLGNHCYPMPKKKRIRYRPSWAPKYLEDTFRYIRTRKSTNHNDFKLWCIYQELLKLEHLDRFELTLFYIKSEEIRKNCPF